MRRPYCFQVSAASQVGRRAHDEQWPRVCSSPICILPFECCVALATDNQFSPTFGQPTLFMDPRRAMISVRLNLGR